MHKTKNKIMRASIVLPFLLVLIVGYSLLSKAKQSQIPASNTDFKKEVAVTVTTAKKQKIQLFQELPARVSAYKISDVRPQVEGIIKKQTFVEGSFVKEGKQLYQIDPAIYQAAFDTANASLKTLQAKKERYQKLIEVEAVSKQEFDDITAAFVQAKADVKKAKTNLNYTKVYAPISGYIGKSNLTEGALVTANQTEVLTTITQLDPIYVDMAQPTKDVLAMGNQNEIPVSLIVDDQNYEQTGTLKFSENFADESTDSVRLRAKFSNKNKKLIPGMFVVAKLHLKPIEAITVPQKAATRMPDGNLSIWVVGADNIAKLRIIKAEKTFSDSWIVSEGLEENELVIVEGFLKIADGIKVNPITLETKANTEEKNQTK